MARGGTPSMRAGWISAAFRTASASSICAASSRRQRRSASSLASGRSDSALRALLRLSSSLPHSTPVMSACSATARARHVERLAQAGDAGGDQHRAAGGAMEARAVAVRARLHDIEGHHARDGALRGAKMRAQNIDIADAVLQADDDRLGRSMARDQLGHVGGGAALDGDEHDLGPGHCGARVGGQRQRRGRQGPVGAVEVGDAQAMPGDGVGQHRAQQQGDVASGQRQAAAHIAADAAGAGNDDA